MCSPAVGVVGCVVFPETNIHFTYRYRHVCVYVSCGLYLVIMEKHAMFGLIALAK